MAKQQAPHRYIFKINSSRLRKAKWNLTLSLSEARMNDEVIALNDSQMLRWIDELNGLNDSNEHAGAIKAAIRSLKKQPSTPQNRHEIKRLYAELDSVQFKPDYMNLVVDKNSDYIRACKGFTINGIEYVRLLGTSGGVKNSTIVFVSKRLAPVLRERIDNGRNMEIEQIPAKFEAYRALTCSGSIPVSMPKGILVVSDCETQFSEDVIMLNDENGDEPEMSFVSDFQVTMNASDGFGMILPSLAERWSNELGLDYVSSGFNTRCSWEKGMVFCFDFVDFANRVAGKHVVKDAWGNDVDITKVEMVLTTSMLKLWSCYDSLDHYMECCEKNHYTFSVTKTCPKKLDNYRSLNYQFIQSYNLTDEQIDELIMPTVNEIHDIIHGDYRKALLFLGCANVSEDDIDTIFDGSNNSNTIRDALIANPQMFNDPFVRKTLYRLLETRINRAKIGVIDVHGNYSLVCGDPYALCQHIFNLDVTGLLSAGQIYSRYWIDEHVSHVACFRAPMSCHNNIRKMGVASSDDMLYWYRYMNTVTILNAWDTTQQALNGCDFDGDLVFTTDNRVLVENIRPTATVYCVQRKASKCIPTEEDLIRANIASFGDDIGRTTNWITSMYDVQSRFDSDSEEYRTLEYRIVCGQLLQQNAIDKVKGIACKPMPKFWYDYHANALPDGSNEHDEKIRSFNLSILADKKPYFMRYIYPDVMKQYNSYVRNTNVKCNMLFRMPIDELCCMNEEDLTKEQKDFIRFYRHRMPVSTYDSVMNRICRRVEYLLSMQLKLYVSEGDFDYSVLKSGVEYTKHQYNSILQFYRQHISKIQEYSQLDLRKVSIESNPALRRENDIRLFKSMCFSVCSNTSQLCDIIVDICYSREGSKQFAWDICSSEIIANLLKNNNNIVTMPIIDDNGDIAFRGNLYSMLTKEYAA